jgi:hypothetical protein
MPDRNSSAIEVREQFFLMPDILAEIRRNVSQIFSAFLFLIVFPLRLALGWPP